LGNFFNWRYVRFVWPLEYLIKKFPVTAKPAMHCYVPYATGMYW